MPKCPGSSSASKWPKVIGFLLQLMNKRYVRQSPPKCAKRQRAPKCTKVPQRAPTCAKVRQRAPKCAKVAPTCAKVMKPQHLRVHVYQQMLRLVVSSSGRRSWSTSGQPPVFHEVPRGACKGSAPSGSGSAPSRVGANPELVGFVDPRHLLLHKKEHLTRVSARVSVLAWTGKSSFCGK